jgi:hypothetical protein
VRARDIDVGRLDEELPGRVGKKGLARFRFDMREVFIAAVPGQVADLETYLERVRPDVLVAEPGMAGACSVIEQRHGVPWATCNITAFAMRSGDTAPFGLGLAPSSSALGGLRNRALSAVIYRTLFRSIDRDYRAMRAALGLAPTRDDLFDMTLSPYLYLQPTVPSFRVREPRGGTCSKSSRPPGRRCSQPPLMLRRRPAPCGGPSAFP